MNLKFFKNFAYIFIGLFFSPKLLFAQPQNFSGLVTDYLIPLINPLLYLIASLMLLAFLWGGVEFMSSAGDAQKSESGKKKMVIGLIALFVLSSLWGLIALFKNTFGI